MPASSSSNTLEHERTPPAPPGGSPLWSVRLLGTVEAVGPLGSLNHWPSRAVAELLARLALAPDRAHPREELVELLWPGVDLSVGRNRLRQALSTLKSLLEPAGAGAPVLVADRMAVRVEPGALDCDARRFEELVRMREVDRARTLYRGELMPGFYGDWVLDERQRLAVAFDRLDAPSASTRTPKGAVTGPQVPAWETAAVPTGLPSYWTKAYGLESVVRRLRATVCVQRLVTVHGPGGSGKTRLAVEVAQTLLGTLGCLAWGDSRGDGRGDAAPAPFDRIAFVSLIDCTDATLTLDAICSALHLDRDVIDNRTRIAAALAGRRTLLVLDNVEQLLDEARLEIARLLRTVATVHVLVTSRRLLELDGEVAFELDGLPLPALEGPLAELTDNPAVALFVDRARAAKAGFELTPRNAQAIGALVRLLTGMPLAVELAASHMGNLTPQELLQQVRPGAGTPMLDLLERPAARACLDARHASMRRVVAWSWRQLTSAQAEMLLRMAIFDTPARLELIAAVAAMALPAARTVLGALRGASLVQSVESAEGVTRYALLQPVREFAAERTAGADACAARQRLRRWLIAFAREAIRLGPSAVAPDVAHVHAAILSAPGDGASKEAVELAVALRWYWDSDSLPLSDLRSLERAVGEISDEALRADGLELLAFGRGAAGFVAEAIAHAEAALALARDDRRRSLVLARWAWTIYMAGRFDVAVEPALEEASTLARRSGDLVAQGMVLRMQAIVACNYRLDYAGAEGLSARAQQIWEQVGHRSMAYSALLTRATMWAWLGRNEDAVTVLLECERVARVEGDWMGWVTATTQMGRVYIRMRRSNDAVAAFRRSITVAWQRHSAPGLARALVHLPEALAMGTEVETAARLCGFAVPHWWHLFKEINRIEARELRRTRLLLHLRLGAARSETLRIEGSGLSIASAVALALGADLMP